MIHAGLMKGKG